MSNIISVSRRTDIPAFYGEQFMNNVHAGLIECIHPTTGHKYSVSLKKDDVACFVFWSKDYTSFLASLHELRDAGYRSYFNYTVTRLPSIFETQGQPRSSGQVAARHKQDVFASAYKLAL
jgi:hypothetical protein